MPHWINTHGGFAMQVSVLFLYLFDGFVVDFASFR